MSSGVEVTSSCLCVGQAFSQGKELCCHTNPLCVWAPRAVRGLRDLGLHLQGGEPGGGESWEAKRPGSGLGGFQGCSLPGGFLTETQSLCDSPSPGPWCRAAN